MNRSRVCGLASLALVVLASGAQAADLIVEDYPGLIEIPGSATNHWDGAFVGVFGGHVWGAASSPVSFDLTGQLLGVNAGVNFTLSNGIVAGVVGDLAWSNLTDAEVFAPPSAFDVNWTGSIRGRVGYDAGAVMPYLTAGLAVARGTLTATTGATVASNTHFGWTAGAGVEVKASDSISLDLSYRYSDYAAAAYGVTDWEFGTHQITAGLNWHF
ncbi:outer membrane protein [Devosia albogilva]|uniref:Outer membrane protein n=1 Tax=Devosia albogilva TaxID=429726 RepID=A0ABW5QMT2_9HYPH